MKKTVNASRRAFLTKSTLLATGGALTALTGKARAQDSCAPASAVRYHKVYDVIVVGSGFAGLAAALEAAQAGRSVLVIDKMPVFGGNSAINGGAVAVAGSPLQEKEGIVDSPELMFKDMLKAGRGLNDKDQLKILVSNTMAAYEFTLRHGVKYKPFVQHFGGHSVPPNAANGRELRGGDHPTTERICCKNGRRFSFSLQTGIFPTKCPRACNWPDSSRWLSFP